MYVKSQQAKQACPHIAAMMLASLANGTQHVTVDWPIQIKMLYIWMY